MKPIDKLICRRNVAVTQEPQAIKTVEILIRQIERLERALQGYRLHDQIYLHIHQKEMNKRERITARG